METIHDFNWRAYGTKDIYLDHWLCTDFFIEDVMNWFYGNQM